MSAASLQALFKQAGVARDLSWFFADWVDADRARRLHAHPLFFVAAQAGIKYAWSPFVTANAGYARRPDKRSGAPLRTPLHGVQNYLWRMGRRWSAWW